MKKFHTLLVTSMRPRAPPHFFPHMATTILALLRWVQQLNNGVQRFPSKLSLNSNLTFIDAGGGCSLALRVVRMRFQPFKCDYNLFIISI